MTDFLNNIAEVINGIVWDVEQTYNLLCYYFDNLEFLIKFGKVYIIVSSILFAVILIMLLFVLINQGEIKGEQKKQRAILESLVNLHEQDSKRDRSIYEQNNQNSGERKPDGTL